MRTELPTVCITVEVGGTVLSVKALLSLEASKVSRKGFCAICHLLWLRFGTPVQLQNIENVVAHENIHGHPIYEVAL